VCVCVCDCVCVCECLRSVRVCARVCARVSVIVMARVPACVCICVRACLRICVRACAWCVCMVCVRVGVNRLDESVRARPHAGPANTADSRPSPPRACRHRDSRACSQTGARMPRPNKSRAQPIRCKSGVNQVQIRCKSGVNQVQARMPRAGQERLLKAPVGEALDPSGAYCLSRMICWRLWTCSQKLWIGPQSIVAFRRRRRRRRVRNPLARARCVGGSRPTRIYALCTRDSRAIYTRFTPDLHPMYTHELHSVQAHPIFAWRRR
jgi:hypothetical protein